MDHNIFNPLLSGILQEHSLDNSKIQLILFFIIINITRASKDFLNDSIFL
jgi:hypothetical protein